MATLTLQDLGGLSLQNGDDDGNRIWGGGARPGQDGTPVAELQTALIKLGTLTFSADGQFGQHTEEALRRFQWYVAHQRSGSSCCRVRHQPAAQSSTTRPLRPARREPAIP